MPQQPPQIVKDLQRWSPGVLEGTPLPVTTILGRFRPKPPPGPIDWIPDQVKTCENEVETEKNTNKNVNNIVFIAEIWGQYTIKLFFLAAPFA